MPCDLVCHLQVLHFHALILGSTFSGPSFLVDPICCACKVQEESEGIVSGSPDQVHQGYVEHLSTIHQVSQFAGHL